MSDSNNERKKKEHEREAEREREKYIQIAQGKVTKRNKCTERDNKLIEGRFCVSVCLCV